MTDKDCPVPEPFSAAIGSIFFLTLLFFLTFIGRFIFAPLMPAISSELGLSHSQAGSIFLAGSMGVFIGSVSSGFVSSRLQHRGTIALSLTGSACALLLCTLLMNLWALRGAVLMLGLMAGMNLPSNVATITALVSRQDWGKALAVQQMAPPLSLVLGPLLTILLLFISGVVTILLGLLSGKWLKVAVFLQPALIVCYFPAGFAALARSVQPNLRSIATGWVTPSAIVLGAGLFPFLLGYMGQTKTFASGIILAGAVITAGSILPFFLKLIEKMDDGC